MAITGTVNCQCNHVFILSSVDLSCGEGWDSLLLLMLETQCVSQRFANTDMSLAMEIRKHLPNKAFQVILKLEAADVNHLTTYDSACQYVVHLLYL